GNTRHTHIQQAVYAAVVCTLQQPHKRRSMKKIIHDGDAIPWGYRIAYRDVLSWHAVAYPIGIHLIARLVRRVWELSFRYRPSALENLISKATEAEIERRIKAGRLRRGFDLLMKQFCDLHFGSTLKRPPGVFAFPPDQRRPDHH